MKAIVQIAAAFAIASFSFGNSSAGIQDRIAGGGAHQASPMGSDANNEPPRTILVAEEQAAASALDGTQYGTPGGRGPGPVEAI